MPELWRCDAMTSSISSDARVVQPDVVLISSYSDSRVEYAIDAMDTGAYVFIEKKTLATSVKDAHEWLRGKLAVGYFATPSYLGVVILEACNLALRALCA